MSQLKILIADDHPLFRKGLRETIESDSGLRVVREAADGVAALEAIRQLKPDICVLDIQMPRLDGIEVVRQMRTLQLRGEVIFLTMYKEPDMLDAALELEVKGYVLKESAVEEILQSIRSVSGGHRYISPSLSDFLVAAKNSGGPVHAAVPGLDRLTPSERRILKMIAADKTSKEIADELGLSPRTVENHRTNICGKLEVHGVHSLLKFAYDNKARL